MGEEEKDLAPTIDAVDDAFELFCYTRLRTISHLRQPLCSRTTRRIVEVVEVCL